jgi:acyl carrier protein phosphodiesterase
VWLPDGIPELLAADRDLEVDFQNFYPELMAHAMQVRSELSQQESK